MLRNVAKPFGEVVRYALDSWSRTARLCCLLLASGIATGLYSLIKGG